MKPQLLSQIPALVALSASMLLVIPATAETKVAPLTGKTQYLEQPPTPAPKPKAAPVKPAPAKPSTITKSVAAKTTKPSAPPKPAEVKKPTEARTGGLFGLFSSKRTEPPTPSKPDAKKTAEVKPQPKPKAPETPVKPQLSKTAEATVKKNVPADKVTPEPKKPGFFARLLGGKPDSAPSKMDPKDRPTRPRDWESKYVVTDDQVKAYRFGPSQTGGPDEYLERGTIVSIKKSGRAWSDISLEGGHIYTVGSDQIRKAREDDFAPPVVASIRPMNPNGGPLPVGDLEPLPPVDLPDTVGQPKQSLDASELLLPPLPPP